MSIRIAAILFALCVSASAHAQIPWTSSVDQAKALAGQQQKLVLLHFYTDNCPPCRRLEQNVFPVAAVQQSIQHGYAPVKINAKEAPELARMYNVFSYPVDVVTDSRGREIFRTISPQDPNRYSQMLHSTYASYQAKLPHNQQIDNFAGAGAIAQAAANYTAGDAGQYAQAANQQLSQTQQFAQHVAQQNQYVESASDAQNTGAQTTGGALNYLQQAQQQAQQYNAAAQDAVSGYGQQTQRAANDYMQSVQQYGAAAASAGNNYLQSAQQQAQQYGAATSNAVNDYAQQSQQAAGNYLQSAQQQAQQYGAVAGEAVNRYSQQTQDAAGNYLQAAQQQAQQYSAAATNAVAPYGQPGTTGASDYMQAAQQQAQQYGAAAGNAVNDYTQKAQQAANNYLQSVQQQSQQYGAAANNTANAYTQQAQQSANDYLQNAQQQAQAYGAAASNAFNGYSQQAQQAASDYMPSNQQPTQQYGDAANRAAADYTQQAPQAAQQSMELTQEAENRVNAFLQRQQQSGEAPQSTANPYFQQPGASASLAAQGSATTPQDATNGSQPMIPPAPEYKAKVAKGPRPRGLEGFCPVTLLTKRKWAKGDSRFGAVHRSRTYLFADETAQKEFLANPDRYAPLLSGYDPVAYRNSGELVDGDRNYGLTYKNQMLLFSSEEALKQFEQSPESYMGAVRQAMTGQTIR